MIVLLLILMRSIARIAWRNPRWPGNRARGQGCCRPCPDGVSQRRDRYLRSDSAISAVVVGVADGLLDVAVTAVLSPAPSRCANRTGHDVVVGFDLAWGRLSER
ncbi:hypothetical protein JR666_001596 [Salmonella enterica]|nr:hypothetical protein [Salmonella enterica]